MNAYRFIGEPEQFYLSGGMCENRLFRRSFPETAEVQALGRFVLVEGLLNDGFDVVCQIHLIVPSATDWTVPFHRQPIAGVLT